MEIDTRRKQTVNFIVLVVLLVAMVAGLGMLIYLSRDAISRSDDPLMEKVLARLAWIALALMGLALVLLMLSVMHFVRSRMPRHSHGPTPYVDAWSLAGQRMTLEDDSQDEPDDENES